MASRKSKSGDGHDADMTTPRGVEEEAADEAAEESSSDEKE